MGCLFKTDALFYEKWRLVLLKMTRRFFSIHVFFLDNERKMKKRKEKRKIKCEKSHNQVLSRVRVRTRCQEFLSFCCHKCHGTLHKSLFLNLLRYIFIFVLQKRRMKSKIARQILMEKQRKTDFLPLHRAVFSSILVRFSFQCVTLVTAKNQHRCWKARTRTYAWEVQYNHFTMLKHQILCIGKIKCHFFAIFSLFGAISSHIQIGAQRNIAL